MAAPLTPPRIFSEIVLACGMFQVAVPSDWELEDDHPLETIFVLPDGGKMRVTTLVIDEPRRMANNDYVDLLTELLAKEEADRIAPSFDEWRKLPGPPKLTMSARREAKDGNIYRHVWRSLHVRDGLIRIVTWYFEPASEDDGAALAAYADALHAQFQRTDFADETTELDLIPVTPELKVVPFGGSVIMRMPAEWQRKRKNPDGTGRRLVDEPVHDRWTLWVDWDLFANNEDEPEAAKLRALEKFAEGKAKAFEAGPHNDKVIVREDTTEDKDGPIRVTAWHRFAVRGPHIVLAHFSLVVDATKADLPELLAVRDLVGREAMNAVLLPPEQDHQPRPKTA